MDGKAARAADWLAAAVLVAAVSWLAYGPGQSDFAGLAAGYAAAFAAYVWLVNNAGLPLRQLLVLAVLLRLIVLPAMPQLSDDVYRFIWDGRLIVEGINPFAHLPAYYMELEQPPAGLTPELFEQLNSPEYFTIYPPVAQGIFALSVLIFPGSIYGSTLVMKLCLMAAEAVALLFLPRLLRQLRLPARAALWYLLNPLMIIEHMGNLHFEGVMGSFLILSLYLLVRGQWGKSALAMALSIAAKLLPLLFLPLLIRRLGWRRSVAYFAVLGGALLLLFAPLLGEAFLHGFGSSLDLYFRRFEFNASVYYLLRWVGYQWTGYNEIAVIGPALALATFSGIVLMTVLERIPEGRKWQQLPVAWLAAIGLYLLLTPTVHPWYVSLPLLLCCFTSYRFPVLWSALIVLTYINYSFQPYTEQLWAVALEYGLVALYAFWEWLQKRKRAPAGAL
mgnify:CR=1 FL=1